MSSARGDATQMRIEELAELTGATVRNIRVYQEKGLLPTPIRRGRAALYGPEHRRRLQIVLNLLDRGYTFATIDELFAAERMGLTITDLVEAESAKALRRPQAKRRRYNRADAEAVAGFEFSETLIAMSDNGGMVSDLEGEDAFHTDAHMYDLFRELVHLGLTSEDIDTLATLVFEGQARAAEAMDVVVDLLGRQGQDSRRSEERISTLVGRAGAAVSVIFQNAAQKRVRRLLGLPERD